MEELTEEARELRRIYHREYARKNKEKINEYQRKYFKRHPEKQSEYKNRYWNKKAQEIETTDALKHDVEER